MRADNNAKRHFDNRCEMAWGLSRVEAKASGYGAENEDGLT